MKPPSSARLTRVAFVLTGAFVAAAVWRLVVALQEHVAGLAITDDPSARELQEASALLELALAIILMAHAAGAFVYTRREVAVRWAAVVAVALASSLGLVVALRGVTGSFHPVLMIVLTGIVGHGYPGQWLSSYVGGVVGCTAAWVLAAPDPDPFIGLFVIVPSVVYVLVGTAVGNLAARRSVP